MKKTRIIKKIIVFSLIAIMAAGFTGCGEISYDDIKGDWTLKTINGQDIASYAEALGFTVADAAVNLNVSEDNKITVSSGTGESTYSYERRSDGFEVLKEEGKTDILFSVKYDKDAKTLSYQVDPGNGENITMVFEKGTTDLKAE